MTVKLAPWLPAWLHKELNVWRLLIITLLLAALVSVAAGLTTVVRGLDLGLLLPIAILGTLTGWTVAATPWPGWLAGTVAASLGGIMLTAQVGRLGLSVMAVLGRLLALAWQTLRWPANNPPELAPLQGALAHLGLAVTTLWSRLLEWLAGLAGGEPLFDPAATALAWGIGLWAVAAWAGWTVRRREQPWLGILPAGALLVMSMAYAGGNFAFLLLLLGFTWLLAALVAHALRERRWQADGIDFALDIRTDLTVITLWLVAGLVTLAQLTPVVSLQTVADAGQRFIWGQPLQAGPLARSLGLEPPPGPAGVFDKARLGGLPRRHLLGAGPELSRQVALVVQPDAQAVDRYHYWRSLTYDRYTGAGWLAGKTKTMAYTAGQAIEPPFEVAQPALLTEQIQIVRQGEGLLYAAGALLSVDQPYEVAWRRPGDAFGATVAAASYRVTSLLPAVDESQLRRAGSRYPAWVRQRYLALPADLPVRVLALARDLTATQPTPYERARAIESYLRRLPYDLNLPAPPPNRDVVDYFLFDLQRGYCDYYASAMVVLARAAGIPARLVIGYAGGEFDPAQGHYRVSEAEAHAWAELYFPGYGWLEFEPTAARPPRTRATEPATLPEMALNAPPSLETAGPMVWGPVWKAILGGVGLVLAGSAAWSIADTWRLAQADPAVTITRLYQRLRQYGPRLAVSAPPGATPYEFSDALISQIALQSSNPAPGIERLTDLYMQAAYSARRPSALEQRQAIQTWRRLRWRLWLAWARLKVREAGFRLQGQALSTKMW